LLKNISVVGAGWGAYVLAKPDLCRQVGAEIDRLVAAGGIRPVVGARFPLHRAAEAMRLIEERRAAGKVVLDVRGG
ncbi:MAG: zinc-binding dehydrogenase, partial [Candidatus Dormibacteria bacterium]